MAICSRMSMLRWWKASSWPASFHLAGDAKVLVDGGCQSRGTAVEDTAARAEHRRQVAFLGGLLGFSRLDAVRDPIVGVGCFGFPELPAKGFETFLGVLVAGALPSIHHDLT